METDTVLYEQMATDYQHKLKDMQNQIETHIPDKTDLQGLLARNQQENQH